MAYKRILTVQDISCVGQCSMTVALPILSACGQEVCILPSAVLSSHTGGFGKPTFRDLSVDIPAIRAHWESAGITFDAILTGYLGNCQLIQEAMDVRESLMNPGGCLVVDPAMADHGKLYAGFDEEYVEKMKGYCQTADILIPNITEAAMLTGVPYQENYDEMYIRELIEGLNAPCIVLTGVSYHPEYTGVVVADHGIISYYTHRKIGKSYHGTGDIFAAAFVGALMNDCTPGQAAKIAADFTYSCIEKTYRNPAHWYGVKFETALPELIKTLNKNEHDPA